VIINIIVFSYNQHKLSKKDTPRGKGGEETRGDTDVRQMKNMSLFELGSIYADSFDTAAACFHPNRNIS